MKFRSLFIFVLFFSINNLFAQSFKEKLFKLRGAQLDFMFMPSFASGNTDNPASQLLSGGIYGLHYGFRYNLVELDDEKSINIGAYPNVGMLFGGKYSYFDYGGIGSFNMPVEVGFNYGAGATYQSNKNHGFSIRTGIDINFVPLISFGEDKEDADFKKLYILPHITIGYQKFGKTTGNLYDVYLRFDFAKNELETPTSSSRNDQIFSPFILRFGGSHYIGY